MQPAELAPPEPIPLQPGDRVARFEIVRLLGSGGSADVYEAEHLDLGRRVALKIVRVGDEACAETLARFRREARTAGALRHPHIADVFDVGHTDSGDPYLVMELLDGETLDVVAGRGPMPLAEALEIAAELCDALAFVHAHGVVHRDVKPHNLVLHRGETGRTVVKLVDFGISKPAEAARERAITRTGLIVGTPHYMPPELLMGAETAPGQDVYAAGVVLFECLTGRPPFDASSLGSVITAVLRETAPPVTNLRPDCPAPVAALVAKAIARTPEARFASATELRAAILDVVQALGLKAGAAAFGDEPESPRESGVRQLVPTGSERIEAALAKTDLGTGRVLLKDGRRRAIALGPAVALTLLGAAAVSGAIVRHVVAVTPAAKAPRSVAARPTQTVSLTTAIEAAPPLVVERHAADVLPRAERVRATAPRAGRAAAPVPPVGASSKQTDVVEPPPGVRPADRETARSLVRDALSAYVSGQWPRAQALYRAAVRVDPSNGDGWRGLAGVSAHMGQPSEARRAYRRYLSIAPTAPDARAVRAAIEALP